MKAARGIPGRWRLPLAGAVLGAALLFFFIKTQAYDSASYFEHVALLRHIKQLDARWELDVMKSKIGLNHSYDALVDPLPALQALPLQLQVLEDGPDGGDRAALAASIAAFQQALAGKAALIESFKSHNAVFSNSLAFLPTAAADLAGGEAEAAPPPRVAAGVTRVLLDALTYEDRSSINEPAELHREMAALAAMRGGLAGQLRPRLDIFLAHVRTVLRENDAVLQLLERIAAVPTAAHLDRVHAILTGRQQRAALQLQRHRTYLLLFAAALSALLLYSALRLVRSHAVINRVNNALQQSNDQLENRVQRRSAELQEAQGQLVAAARQAGMAEIATSVLHNVGNVLNSVSVSAALAAQQVRDSRLGGLDLAVQLMREQGAGLGHFLSADERGRCLPGYLGSLAAAAAAERLALLAELAALGKSVDHIKEIVAAQQSHAGVACIVEPCRLAELLDQAVAMSALSLARHQVVLRKEYGAVPPLLLDRHRVLQILINLISNAKRAVDALPVPQRSITLRLRQCGGGTAQVDVVDNGEGIAPQNMERIFAHGFTTRRDGHGFGLHSCVLTAREMGGSLAAHSDGIGQGAAFTLELPLHLCSEAA